MRKMIFIFALVVPVLMASLLVPNSSVPELGSFIVEASNHEDRLNECLEEARQEYEACMRRNRYLGDAADTICSPLRNTREAACWAEFCNANDGC